MRPVPIDLMCQLVYPTSLKSGGGAFSFVTKKASRKTGGYKSMLWLGRFEEGRWEHRPLTAPGSLLGHWWLDAKRILLARPGTAEEKAFSEGGLPYTLLQILDTAAPGEALDLCRLFLEVEDAAALPNGELVLLARCDFAAEAALEKAKGDPAAALELLEQEADYTVLETLPFWENGDGLIGQKRRRLYLLRDGKALPLTDEATEVERFALFEDSLWFTGRRAVADRMPVGDRLYHLSPAAPGGAAADISIESGAFLHAEVVPLGKGAAFVAGSNMKRHGLNQNPSFYRLELGPGGEKQVTCLYDGGEYSGWMSAFTDTSMPAAPHWQAHGQTVRWITTLNQGSRLMAIHTGTGAITPLSGEEGALQEFAQSGEQLIFAGLRGLNGPELYRLSPNGKEQRLTHFNDEALQGLGLAQPKPLAFTGGRGQEIRGYVLRPPALAEGEKCPAILDIHGGPKTVYGPMLFHEMQYWASQGYAVLFCNPTGGDGRGDDFADIRGQYGGVDYDDLMAFTDAALAACDFIDPTRLGVTGGSYGGFMTNWIIGHTGRFAAAVSQRSISNWTSMTCLSDIGYYFEPSELDTTPWANPSKVWNHSPLKYAQLVNTPTLFIHAEQDYRCPLAEGMQMYTALADFGVPTRMCIFKGENHELSRSGKPAHRIRRLREITDWFDKYLKNPGKNAE